MCEKYFYVFWCLGVKTVAFLQSIHFFFFLQFFGLLFFQFINGKRDIENDNNLGQSDNQRGVNL